jgi:hypothetical protein
VTLLALLLAAQAAAPSHLGEIRMHLFEHASGHLSDDVSPPSDFSGWNTTLHADDLVVIAEVVTTGEQFISRPLTIVARRRNGRILGQRSFRAILTSNEGHAFLPLWLNDVACAGEIQVTVTYGRETKRETLSLECGE